MARPVYSKRFMQWLGVNAPQTYVVPSGFTAVIRDFDIYVDNSSLISSVNVYLLGGLGQILDWFTTDADTTVVHQWRGRQVIYEGETMYVEMDGVSSGAVCGYLLTNP